MGDEHDFDVELVHQGRGGFLRVRCDGRTMELSMESVGGGGFSARFPAGVRAPARAKVRPRLEAWLEAHSHLNWVIEN